MRRRYVSLSRSLGSLLGCSGAAALSNTAALQAVDNFYYAQPEKGHNPWKGGGGRRSWGGGARYDPEGLQADRHAYAKWWNTQGTLALQVESLNAATNAHKLAMPGVDMLTWGPADLSFDIEAHPEHPIQTVDDCVRHALQVLKSAGNNTRLSLRTAGAQAAGIPGSQELTGVECRQHYIDMGVTVFMEGPQGTYF